MAMEQYAFLHRCTVPTRDQWQAAIEVCGFDFQLYDELKPFEYFGFLPCKLSGRDTGFELYYDDSPDLLNEFAHISQGCDCCISFRWGGDMNELASVMIASYALAKNFGAIVSYEGEGPRDLHDFLTETLASIEQADKELPDLTDRILGQYLLDQFAPYLGKDYKLADLTTLVRMRGPFIQYFTLSRTVGSSLRVCPGFFVAGAEPSYPGMHDTLGLYGEDPHRWSFVKPELTPELATAVIDMLKTDSPVSFFDELTDASIDKAIDWFLLRTNHWATHQFRAFIAILQGRPSARDDLRRAISRYRKKGLHHPPSDYDVERLQRYEALGARLDRPDCIVLCRADAEEHAAQMKLPPVEWPTEWPTEVPAPWPNVRRGIADRFLEAAATSYFVLISWLIGTIQSFR